MRSIKARAVVLACGGLYTTRLLLAAQTMHPRMFGGAGGPLGRYYMGHIEGRIAQIVFDRPGAFRDFDFTVDASGRYVPPADHHLRPGAANGMGLLNLAAWPDNPALGQPGHKSAILSLAYLSLAAPGLGGLLAPEVIPAQASRGRGDGAPPPISVISSAARPRRRARRPGISPPRRRLVASPGFGALPGRVRVDVRAPDDAGAVQQ